MTNIEDLRRLAEKVRDDALIAPVSFELLGQEVKLSRADDKWHFRAMLPSDLGAKAAMLTFAGCLGAHSGHLVRHTSNEAVWIWKDDKE